MLVWLSRLLIITVGSFLECHPSHLSGGIRPLYCKTAKAASRPSLRRRARLTEFAELLMDRKPDKESEGGEFELLRSRRDV